jgi:hypothetical protein
MPPRRTSAACTQCTVTDTAHTDRCTQTAQDGPHDCSNTLGCGTPTGAVRTDWHVCAAQGTDHVAGASIAAALLEQFDARGMRGIFATHHHEMLDYDLKLSATETWQMGTRQEVDDGVQLSTSWLSCGPVDACLLLTVADAPFLPFLRPGC